jgi:tRNA (mo5U34)-methyltransferase
LTPEEIRRRVAEIRWYHRIDLGNGIVTPGLEDSRRKLGTLSIPERLDGLSVLDVGSWDGFFAFEAERRGAARVLATDHYCWSGGGWGTKQGFDLAHAVFGSAVESRDIDVLYISADTVGVFDLVLFLGVLYHLENPLLALRQMASVTGKQLILETVCDCLDTKRPLAAFYPGAELSDDPTNWWGPNPPAVEGMLRTAGFRDVRLTYLQPATERFAHAAALRARCKAPFWRTLHQGRAVFHAFK